MANRFAGVMLAGVLSLAGLSVSHATQPAALRAIASEGLALSEIARRVLAEFHLKDVQPVSSMIPEIVIRETGVRLRAARAVIDARVINIYLINRARRPPMPQAATTAQAIDAWTNAVLLGSPPAYGTSVDQWVAMAHYLGPRY
jgi:hypothetical protein